MGCGGLILVLVLSYVLGLDPLQMLISAGGGGGAGPAFETVPPAASGPVQSGVQEEELVQFVSFVLDDAQAGWANELPRHGVPYRDAKLVLFRDAVQSGCGFGSAATGPFYCPADEKVYIDSELLRGAAAPLRRLG